jgi:predicted CoA-substrate-specific enzyme activase
MAISGDSAVHQSISESSVEGQGWRVGIDIGSTTAKVAVLHPTGQNGLPPLRFSTYRRHDAKIAETLAAIFADLAAELGPGGDSAELTVCTTGSAGMGVADRLAIPFVQEVVAAIEVVKLAHPQVRTLVDIGGEDSKLVLIDERGRADMRMNGSCAGGTGAFIDQMAALLAVNPADLESLAQQHREITPIASRCGVFAKTDVQNLLSRNVAKADIAASVFHAVAAQTVTSLARAATVRGKMLLSGGPLTFLPSLRAAVVARFGMTEADVEPMAHGELLSALGAALAPAGPQSQVTLGELRGRLAASVAQPGSTTRREPPLFASPREFAAWNAQRFEVIARGTSLEIHDQPCFLGIDSGSTTTKLALVDSAGRLVLESYAFNHGDPVGAVQRGLRELQERLDAAGVRPKLTASAATGYGEDLVHNVFGLDLGLVETIAHLRAARELAPGVTFVLDIGGQDMKAMFIDAGEIRSIEINEACSSGCGSFLQTFSEVLGIPIGEFAERACAAEAPCQLGSRCTVFMNSRVKQFLREGASVEDLAAGLAYSVVRNCLEKVLRIHDPAVLGDTVVVQGGTFLNPAVQRAFERLTGKRAICPDAAGVIGAWGAALVALDHHRLGHVQVQPQRTFAEIANVGECRSNDFVCQACENKCSVRRLRYPGKAAYFSGNRCDRVQSNRGKRAVPGTNLALRREELWLGPKLPPRPEKRLRIGLPRVLNLFESLPFWRTLLDGVGLEPLLSPPTTAQLYQQGIPTLMSDSLCLPAKVVHGHVLQLLEQKPDAIFYPQVVFELPEADALSSFNCPIVTGYPEVIRSAIDPQSRGLPFHAPVLTFRDKDLLRDACRKAVLALGATGQGFERAFEAGLDELARVRREQQGEGQRLVNEAARTGRLVILLIGRPYHLDRYINHGIPDIIAGLGLDVITTEMVPVEQKLDGLQVLTQWAFPNRLYHAARYAVQHRHVEVVQINSFGCGPDSMAIDEVRAILQAAGKRLTVVRVDESASPGSIRLRLRTLMETLAIRPMGLEKPEPRHRPPPFTVADRDRILLGPSWFPMLDRFTEDAFAEQGYQLKMLPPPDDTSRAYGLKYTNHEMCYPAILVVGDMLRALDSGQYGPRVAAIISQTGGQCRASCYASLIGKGLTAAGYTDVPVVTLHMDSADLHDQPGFTLDRLKLARRGLYSIVLADALAMMERAMLVREVEAGSASRLAKEYVERWVAAPERSAERCIRLIADAAEAFAQLPVRPGPFARIGMVGEIYVKYCDYGNGGVVQWLAERGVETVVPNLTTFFIQSVINLQADAQAGIAAPDLKWLGARLLDDATDQLIGRVNRALEPFAYGHPLSRPRELAERAAPIVSLTNQYGEGWLLPGEMIELAEAGIDNIVCVQPFGCIANQVVAKGIEKRLRELHPTLNLLFLDMDHNVSEANAFNRLHFLVRAAETTLAAGPQHRAGPPPTPAQRRTERNQRMAGHLHGAARVLGHRAGRMLDDWVAALRGGPP